MTPAAELRDIWPPGTVVRDNYIIESKIGEGGFGVTYLARHRWLEERRVIKRLHEQFARQDEFVRRFLREARALAKLKSCPYVVNVEDFAQTQDGNVILVMEYVAGGSLKTYMGQSRPVEHILTIAAQIAEALNAAHAANLFHRDLKPDNILLTTTGDVRIIDFGLVVDLHGTHTAFGGATPGYAPPEQYMLAGHELDGRVDLYAFGVTLYRMLTGHLPYESRTPKTWMDGNPDPPSRRNPEVRTWDGLDRLVVHLVQPDREKRPESAARVVADIAGIRNRHAQRKETSRPTAERSPQLTTQTGRHPRSPLLVPSVVAGIAILASGGYYAFRSRGPVTPPERVVSVSPPDITPTKTTSVKPREKPKQQEHVTDSDKRTVQASPNHDLERGDLALNNGDYDTAFALYRQSPESSDRSQRLKQLQSYVENYVDDRTQGMWVGMKFDQAQALADKWRNNFPDSQVLNRIKAHLADLRSKL